MGEVLACLEKHGLRVKKRKCTFMQDSVENLGHQIDSSGLHTMPDKLNAIIKAPEPTTVQELHLFLGLLNYYAPCSRAPGGSGLRSVSTPAGKGTPHFLSCLGTLDPSLPLRLAADASAYEVGHHTWWPIAYASCKLSQNEWNYAQLEKEALVLIFGIKKCHQYLLGGGSSSSLPTSILWRPYSDLRKSYVPPLGAVQLQR